MEEATKLHRDVPYGYVLVLGAVWRAVAQRRRALKPCEPVRLNPVGLRRC
jgi:hypothetical protein